MVIIEFYCNNEDYATALKNTIGENATIDGTIVTVTFDEAVDSYSITNLSAQVRMDSLTVYTDEVNSINISTASLSIGESLAMNYYVTTGANLDDAVMYFTFNNETYPVDGELQSDGRYVFTLNEIAPQYMGENIKAELKFGEFLLAVQENYSVKTYAQNKLNDDESSTELKQLLTDMLYYGVAAQTYKEKDNLSLGDIENLLLSASTATPEDSDYVFALGNNLEVSSYPAYFTGANVWFDTVNKLAISFKLQDGADVNKVTATVQKDGEEATTAVIDGNKIYSAGIYATDFATEYTFVLMYDGVVMQTLTYTVNTYAYQKRNSGNNLGELVLALYRYGKSAEAYINAQ